MAHTLQSFAAKSREILQAENNPKGRAKVAVYVVVTAVLLTGASSARCCSWRRACHCVSVGFVGLPWLVHTR